MAKNDFSAEVAENYEQKCLCVLVLDCSGSMGEIVEGDTVETGKTFEIDGNVYTEVEGGISKLDKLCDGLRSFFQDIESDETTSQRLELAIVTFNDSVQVVQAPALISNCEFPDLYIDGNTAMVDAVYEAISMVEARKAWYKETGQPYYRPWIILMTDGEPDMDQDVDSLAATIKKDTADKKYQFLPIGVDRANMDILKSLQGTISAKKLKGTKFSSFFKWLSASMGTVVTSEEGQKTDLQAGGTDWMESFTI